MSEIQKKRYDLEERTFIFTRGVALWCKSLPKDIINIEYIKQVVRSSGSIGANYIEANESLSKKDFAMRIRIARKEAKETIYWLQLLLSLNLGAAHEAEGKRLLGEATELKKILSAILSKSV